MIRMNTDEDLKVNSALNERRLTKLPHGIPFVNSDAVVAFKAIYHKHKQTVLEALYKSLHLHRIKVIFLMISLII